MSGRKLPVCSACQGSTKDYQLPHAPCRYCRDVEFTRWLDSRPQAAWIMAGLMKRWRPTDA